MLWFRDDFAERPLTELLGFLGGSGELGGRALPPDTQEIGLWIYTLVPRDDTRVWVRVRDENRNYGLVDLGPLEGDGWPF